MATSKNPNAGLVDWGDWTEEAAAKDAAQLGEGSAQWMKLAEGRNIVRIIPPPKGVQSPFLIYDQHFITRPDGSKVSFACPNRTAKKPCPVCEHANKLYQTGNKTDQQAAKQFWPKKRILVNVIDRANPEAGPKVLGVPKSVHEDIIKIRNNPDAGGNRGHPLEGFDLCIERKGTGQFDTEYTVIPSRKNSHLGPTTEVMNDWIGTQHDLQPFAKLLEPAEIRAKLNGQEEDAPPRAPGNRQLTGSKAASGSALDDFAQADDDDLNF